MKKKASPRLSQLIAVLRDGEFHDGTMLGQTLKLTRSAVWKMIKKLERYGLKIKSVKGKGYALCDPVVLLDEAAIRKHLQEKKIRINLFETIPSTNDYLKSIRAVKCIQLCITEQQTAGRGRLGRSWHSPFGENIYLSCLYPFHKDLSELAGLSLVVSLAVLRTLQQCDVNKDVYVKWPNDIHCQAKKIAGILIDVQAESHGTCQAIIGIGLNVNMLELRSDEMKAPWTSIREVTSEYQDRNLVCARLINHLLDYMQRFSAHGFASFIDEWVAAEGLQGKTISIKTSNEVVTGQAAGINSQGHLLIKLPDGEVRAFSSGDTTVLK